MKLPKFLYLFMTVLLTVAAWIVIGQSDRRDVVGAVNHAQDRKSVAEQTFSPSVKGTLQNSASTSRNAVSRSPRADRQQAQADSVQMTAKPSVIAGADRLPNTPTASQQQRPETDGINVAVASSIPAKTNRGIQLAENVKLPAAIMALSDPSFKNLTPQQDTALRHVVDTFYKDLAARAEARLSNQELARDHQVVQSSNGEETIIIQPGEDVEKARQRANEIFRALFGDDRYNQVTMQSAMEVMLSPVSDNN